VLPKKQHFFAGSAFHEAVYT